MGDQAACSHPYSIEPGGTCLDCGKVFDWPLVPAASPAAPASDARTAEEDAEWLNALAMADRSTSQEKRDRLRAIARRLASPAPESAASLYSRAIEAAQREAGGDGTVAVPPRPPPAVLTKADLKKMDCPFPPEPDFAEAAPAPLVVKIDADAKTYPLVGGRDVPVSEVAVLLETRAQVPVDAPRPAPPPKE